MSKIGFRKAKNHSVNFFEDIGANLYLSHDKSLVLKTIYILYRQVRTENNPK